MLTTLDDLRRFTVGRNFFKPTTLKSAIHKMGFVQADPIRAPARAQDLILRHRVRNYRAGDLERRYVSLDIDEDVFINYGFVTSELQALMHPREKMGTREKRRTQLLLEFVRARGAVHPREVDEHFSHGSVRNYWGGSSNATTHLLEAMHYRGQLRVARREKGIRIYADAQRYLLPTGADPEQRLSAGLSRLSRSGDRAEARIDAAERRARIDALVDTVVRVYAPLPASSLSYYVRRLGYAVPQWREELTSALQRAKERLAHTCFDGVDWYWTSDEAPVARGGAVTESRTNEMVDGTIRFVAPFDPLVHDRGRFEMLWGWEYRFEAYTPASKRKLGYYALPLLWRNRVIGWANLAVRNGELEAKFGYVGSQPRDRDFKRALAAEMDRMRSFLRLGSGR